LLNIPERWPAPAKLNLMLRIVGRREDGYHLLQTVFQFLQVFDYLRFEVRNDGRIATHHSLPGVNPETDLVGRAARLLQQAGGCSLGADITLEKRLPMGGGLGGGSSDAATTLIALNYLWRLGLGEKRLAELGLLLGADVPVFIHGQAAWGEGVGESLRELKLPEPWYLVLTPACHVSTADVFADPDLTRNSPRMTIRDFLAGSAENDCLPVVRRRYPEVADALNWLGRYARPRLTGTGGCVFAAFERESDALRVHGELPTGLRGFVAQGLNRSPLRDYLPTGGENDLHGASPSG
jgi:4-diphosphocytidyl-2-C-methyl-D-erythritol kinase